MKRYQEATIFFLQVTLVNLWGRGCEIKQLSLASALFCSLGLGFGLVNAYLSSLMNETKSFNLAKCEWLSISPD